MVLFTDTAKLSGREYLPWGAHKYIFNTFYFTIEIKQIVPTKFFEMSSRGNIPIHLS